MAAACGLAGRRRAQPHLPPLVLATAGHGPACQRSPRPCAAAGRCRPPDGREGGGGEGRRGRRRKGIWGDEVDLILSKYVGEEEILLGFNRSDMGDKYLLLIGNSNWNYHF